MSSMTPPAVVTVPDVVLIVPPPDRSRSGGALTMSRNVASPFDGTMSRHRGWSSKQPSGQLVLDTTAPLASHVTTAPLVHVVSFGSQGRQPIVSSQPRSQRATA
jgi:hypothetical protein